MELEIFQAFRKAGVDDATAQAAVESINREIDKRYNLHAAQLFTKADGNELRAQMAEMKTELIKWCVGSMFASAALYGALLKLIQ